MSLMDIKIEEKRREEWQRKREGLERERATT